MSEPCPSAMAYQAIDQSTVTLHCQQEAGHPPRCRYEAEDGSFAEWDYNAPERSDGP